MVADATGADGTTTAAATLTASGVGYRPRQQQETTNDLPHRSPRGSSAAVEHDA
jgi:hypothetical protein